MPNKSQEQKQITESQEHKRSQIVVVQTKRGTVEVDVQLAKLAMKHALDECENEQMNKNQLINR